MKLYHVLLPLYRPPRSRRDGTPYPVVPPGLASISARIYCEGMKRTEPLAFEWQPLAAIRRCDMPGCFVPARYALAILTIDAAGEQRRLHGGDCCMVHARQRSEGLGVAAPAAVTSAASVSGSAPTAPQLP